MVFSFSVLFFPALVSIFIGFFLKEVAKSVEDLFFSEMLPVRYHRIGDLIWRGLRYAGLSIFRNLLALPLYVMAPFINLLVFFIMNSYLLEREYYEQVALRRLRDVEMRALWTRRKGVLWMAGGVITGLLAVPGVNVLASLIAIAFMVHVFEGMRRCGAESLPR